MNQEPQVHCQGNVTPEVDVWNIPITIQWNNDDLHWDTYCCKYKNDGKVMMYKL